MSAEFRAYLTGLIVGAALMWCAYSLYFDLWYRNAGWDKW